MDLSISQSSADPGADRSERRKVYRSRSRGLGMVVVFLIDIALAVDGTIRGTSHSTTSLVVGVVLALLFAIPILRAALAILIVAERGVTARNPFRTVTVAWSEITAFELGRYKVLGCVCLVRRRDGTVVPAFAIQGITGQPRRRTSVKAKNDVDELNERLRRTGALSAQSEESRTR